MYAGWSTGRWFGLAGVVALGVAALGYGVDHGYIGHATLASDQMFAFAAQWIGSGLAALMAFATYGSIRIERKDRGDVEVTELGVRRIYRPGKEEFFPREEIAGLRALARGGVLLVDRTGKRQMVVPRSLDGYRECIAEIKALGVESLPGVSVGREGRRKWTFVECVTLFAITFLFNIFFDGQHGHGFEHWMVGAGAVALLAYAVGKDLKRSRGTG